MIVYIVRMRIFKWQQALAALAKIEGTMHFQTS